MPLHLVDISRTLSRIGRGFATGIDRVETEYVKRCADPGSENLFVARLGRQYLLLDTQAALDILARIEGRDNWGWPSPIDAIRLKLNWEQRSARTFVRMRAKATTSADAPAQLFTKMDLTQFEYINVGHSNLTGTFLEALQRNGCKAIRVMIHDMIPLDHPEFSQAHIPTIFESRMRAVAKYADQIICNSKETRNRASGYFTSWGADLDYVVSHLGIEQLLPTGKQPDVEHRPYYVVLGTIEPRKNHLLLFRVWERLTASLEDGEMPHLYVVGRRGWNNIEAFQFLDESALMDLYVHEKSDLNDSELADLLVGAEALLFPSFVEGFGLPALEAAQLGVPVICSDLATFHENLGDYANYLDPNSPSEWEAAILNGLLTSSIEDKIQRTSNNGVQIPTWEAHFRHVFG